MAQVDFRAYESYSTPNRYAAYSSTFFATLTFKDASELVYPILTPPGSIVYENFDDMFSSEVHASAPATVILPSDIIPHLDDVLPIIRALPSKFSLGMRSVMLTLFVGGQKMTFAYHFSKVCLRISYLACLLTVSLSFISLNSSTIISTQFTSRSRL